MKEKFFAKLDELVAAAKNFLQVGFGNVSPEEATKQHLIEPLLAALGYANPDCLAKEYKILADEVDYLLKSGRPLLFLEAKGLPDPAPSLFEAHRHQIQRYLRNYRISPQQAQMEQPVNWIVLTNFAQFHLIRVNEETPTFSFTLSELVTRREELWELLALENVEANRIEELYDQQLKADLDKRFLADLKRWRLIIANGFALKNPSRSLAELTRASQQLLDRFIFCRMLETHRLIEYNKLARGFSHYTELYGDPPTKPFSEVLKESLFAAIKRDFNTELFVRPQLCDEFAIDNLPLAVVIGHEPLGPDVAAQCQIELGQGEMLPFKHLYGYDFSRMSQDIMGAVYERFLAHKLLQADGRIVIEDTDELRKKEGIYYTPRYIVDYIVEHTVGEKITPVLNEALTLLGYKNYAAAAKKIRELAAIKVLDPAMGSGSFLLRAFDALAKAYADYNAECRKHKRARNHTGLLFDASHEIAEEIDHVGIRVAGENIFGVDLDEQAVEVAKLNLWIRLMAAERDYIRERLRLTYNGSKPLNLLPTLANNLKCGNSLIADPAVAGVSAFDWQNEFPEIVGRGGFHCVVGNPPYRMLQPHNTSDEVLEHLRTNYVRAEFKIDLFHLFLQRAVSLLKSGGHLGYIVPTSMLNNVYAETLRRWLLEQCRLERVAVCSEQVFAEADVHTTILTFRREADASRRAAHEVLTTPIFCESQPREAIRYSRTRQRRFFELAGGVWNILVNEENGPLISRLTHDFVPLKQIAEINRGLISGDREQFFSETKASDAHVPIIEGGDVLRYYTAPPSHFVLFERPESAGGCWEPEVHFAPHKIVIRQIAHQPTASLLQAPLAVTGNIFTIRGASLPEELYLLGIINSRLTEFFWRTMFADFKTSFPQVTAFSLEQLPIKMAAKESSEEVALKKRVIDRVKRMMVAQEKFHKLPATLQKKVAHSLRAPCTLAHYFQKDFTGAVAYEILIDDVQRRGFVHEIQVAADGKAVTVSATVAEDPKGEPQLVPLVRLTFKNEPLRQFVYALWKQFLAEHARKKKWTTGRKPDLVYQLVVNTLEPLVFFQTHAGDNLRTIRDLIRAVADEVGTADLGALEAEIAATDREIDERVYALYGLTPAERKLVEETAGRESA